MKDIQNLADSRKIDIQKVGVKTVRYPITLRDRAQGRQHTVAVANMYVNLPQHFKGTHMSRFVEILNDFHGDFDLGAFPLVLEKMKQRLDAQSSHLELLFPFFYRGKRGMQRYQCRVCGSLNEKLGENAEVSFAVDIPISSPEVACCVDSDSVSQLSGSWGMAEIAVSFRRFFWMEDLIEGVEETVSSCSEKVKNGAGQFCAEELCRVVGCSLQKIDELQRFSVTIRHYRNSCSTFAHLEGAAQEN